MGSAAGSSKCPSFLEQKLQALIYGKTYGVSYFNKASGLRPRGSRKVTPTGGESLSFAQKKPSGLTMAHAAAPSFEGHLKYRHYRHCLDDFFFRDFSAP